MQHDGLEEAEGGGRLGGGQVLEHSKAVRAGALT